MPHIAPTAPTSPRHSGRAALATVRQGAHQLAELEQLAAQMRAKLVLIEGGGRPAVARARLQKVLTRLEDSLEEARDLADELNDMAAAAPSPAAPSPAERAAAWRAGQPWTPGATELQRGRAALLEEFRQPHNLGVSDYARLAGVSRQQIYKDLGATPPKLLALDIGQAGQRLPDWQLQERPRALTRQLLQAAPQLDAWTLYQALRSPSGALEGRTPIQAAQRPGASIEALAALVLDELGLQAEPG